MPPRVARASVASAKPKNAKQKSRKRNLDAYSIASHSIKPSKKDRTPLHRLGESIDDEPRQKRRRADSDDEDEDASEDDSAPRRKLPKRSGRGLEDDGDVVEGEDSDGNEWTLGGLAEDDEDSDLDSDEAFGESDEERFEGFTFRGSSSNQKPAPKKRKAAAVVDDDGEMDLDESEASDEEDGEDDFGEEGVDLATMLDDDNDEDVEGESGEESDEDDADDESPSEADSDDEDDEGDNEERMARLRDRLEALDSANAPKALSAPADEGGVLSVDDLLADLDPAARKQYQAAIKTKRKSQAPKTLTAPLPPRQQAKLERQVASTKAKEQLDRWRDTVIHNRRAEFLTFPLVDPAAQNPIGKEKFATDAQPRGELEENIRKIMEESGMASAPDGKKDEDEEDAIMKAEELGTNDLPVEDVLRRRAELRRTRELLFREEVKAKRIAKIKSKAYRRVHRRERERNAEKERAEAEELGLGLGGEDEKEVQDRRRAEARMSTKHRDSKFAKSMKATNRTVWDEGARGGVQEQARRQEELRRRIAGEEVGSEEGDDDADSEDDGDESDDEARMLRQLNRLREESQGIGAQKGVGNMKFMRDAEERQRKRNAEDVESMRKEMAVADGDEDASEAEEEGIGRAIFGPKAKVAQEVPKKEKRPELEEGDLSDDEAVEDEAADDRTMPVKPQKATQAPKGILKKPTGVSGPLARGSGVPDRRDPNTARAADSEDGMAGSGWLSMKAANGNQRYEESGEELTSLTLAATPGPNDTESKASKTSLPDDEISATGAGAGNTDGWQTVPYTNGANSDDDEPEANPILSAAEQKGDLQSRAFAVDDVALAFAAEKAADMEEEDEKEVSSHLPGWGSWTGDGLSKSIRKSNKKAAHNPLFKTKLPGGVRPEQRKDAKLGNVIVSEKQERKGKKYLAAVLPHGFEGKDMYERSLRVPVGPEWSTKETFQRGTRPRVVVKPGIVKPMERPAL